jgi:hypothetical protein
VRASWTVRRAAQGACLVGSRRFYARTWKAQARATAFYRALHGAKRAGFFVAVLQTVHCFKLILLRTPRGIYIFAKLGTNILGTAYKPKNLKARGLI